MEFLIKRINKNHYQIMMVICSREFLVTDHSNFQDAKQEIVNLLGANNVTINGNHFLEKQQEVSLWRS